MKVKDEVAWNQQVSELKNADEESLKFLKFVELWLVTADNLMAESLACLHPYDALSKAFEIAEQTLGFLSVEWISQMLLVIVQHWVEGDRVWESLSVWERRMVEQATAIKIVELQSEATGDLPGPAETP